MSIQNSQYKICTTGGGGGVWSNAGEVAMSNYKPAWNYLRTGFAISRNTVDADIEAIPSKNTTAEQRVVQTDFSDVTVMLRVKGRKQEDTELRTVNCVTAELY
jgi:hypothetical protein